MVEDRVDFSPVDVRAEGLWQVFEAARHFLGKDYTEKEWLSKFAAWDLCPHSPKTIRGGG